MCGIAGYVGAVSPQLLPAMVALLKHRGPDDEGVHVDDGAAVGLGMTRLSIIDLETGHQPMATRDGAVWIVFNGEVYNFRDLRTGLEARGHQFHTRSDTEVLLAAYEAYGDACVDHLRGMFAFAIWDGRRRRLLLARDRLGQKPLYYAARHGRLVFASELKALLLDETVSRAVDWTALHHYLAFGYTPGDRSIFADVAKLPAAHIAVFENGTLRLARYWAMPAGAAATAQRVPAADAPRLVRHELREAVRLRLESDVPVGVFLSGGIDSSALVASVREVTGQRIKTFTVGFGRAAPSFDELPYARMVAERFETEHHEEVVEPAIAELLPSIVAAFDEPFADSSAVPTWVVAQVTARHVKVALSGVGGDETFAGYPRYLGVRLSGFYEKLPRRLRTLPAAAVLRLLRESETSWNWGGRIRRFLAGAELPMPDRYLGWTRFFGVAELERLATPALRRRLGGDVDAAQRAAFASAGHDDPMDGAFRIDLTTYLPDDLLAMGDRMSMAHSIELRAPFCDHHLVEQSLRIAPSAKLPGLYLKGLLKSAFADELPAALLSRRKQGFMIPLSQWLQTYLSGQVDELLSPQRLAARGLFSPDAVARIRQEHAAGQASHADRLWSLMMLELWMQRYLDGHGAPWSLR